LSSFRDWIADRRVVVFDGAMGTMLYSRGAAGGSCYDELNLTHPGLVRSVLSDYVEAGADVITTNTFGANPLVLERYYGLGSRAADINTSGAEIARSVSSGRLVAGSVGPLTRPAEVFDELTPGEMTEAFRLQIGALVAGGVDLIVFETFNDPRELAAGIEVLHGISGLPCVAMLTFLEGGQTLGGLHPLHAGHILDNIEADVVGVNCGTGPMDTLKVIQRLAQATGKPLIAMPNAGLARFERGRFVYPDNPQHTGLYAGKLVAAGCSCVGGCCGTTPVHVRAMKTAVDGLVPGARKRISISPSGDSPAPSPAPQVETTLGQMLQRRLVLSVEVDPPRGPDGTKLLARLRRLKGLGVDAVNVSDGPMARLRMSPSAFSLMVQRELKLEVIIHSTCRDKNILALQSDLLGLSAMGLRNVLALSGDPPSIGDYPFATAVYDVRSEGLIRVIDSLNRGKDVLGNKLNAPAGLFCGTGVSAAPPDPEAEVRAVERKAAAGLRFVQTQPVFDVERFAAFMEKLRHTGLPVIAGLMPVLTSAGLEYLQNEVPGINIPSSALECMRDASGAEDERERGLELARATLESLRRLDVGGICIMPSLHGYDVVEDLLR
jgi:homocysteine S-methyltransferase